MFMSIAKIWKAAPAIGVLLVSVSCSSTREPNQALLEQHRNLGKAFYENPTTQDEAVAEFEEALRLAPDSVREKLNYALALLNAGREQEAVALLQEVQSEDPSLPYTWFNLGLYDKQQGDTDEAIRQFEGMTERTPEEATGYYQLGTLYRQVGRNTEARAAFERAAELDPLLAAARFQLYNLVRLDEDEAEAAPYLAEFERLQELQKDWVVPEDVEWSVYSEIYDPPAERTVPTEAPPPTYSEITLPGTIDPKTAGLALIDAKGTGETDLLAWSSAGVHLYARGTEPVKTALDDLTGVVQVAPGDINNDGLPDLAVLTDAGPQLWRNTGGDFLRQPADLPPRAFQRAVWIDYDHDYDLDLILFSGSPALLRNQGEAGWADRTSDFPFVPMGGGGGGNGPVKVIDADKLRIDPDGKGFDLAVFYSQGEPTLYRDLLGGRYVAEPFEGTPPPADEIDADFDADGGLDRVEIAADRIRSFPA